MTAQRINIGDLLEIDWEYENGASLMLVVGACRGPGFVVVDCLTGERLELHNTTLNEYVRRVAGYVEGRDDA